MLSSPMKEQHMRSMLFTFDNVTSNSEKMVKVAKRFKKDERSIFPRVNFFSFVAEYTMLILNLLHV